MSDAVRDAMDRPDAADAIALVGMAGRFPGAPSVDALWDNLCAGVESIRRFTRDELEAAGVPEELLDDPAYVPVSGYLGDIDLFDAGFFGYSRGEAEMLDPQQRAFLECCWEALESAGLDPGLFDGAVGVFAGGGLNTYLLHNLGGGRTGDGAGDFLKAISNDKDFLTTRVAYKLDLRGPALTVQTACSTSLVAVHLACEALRGFECDAALAGGVTITVPQVAGYLHQEGMIHSRDGHLRAFDAAADGAVFGSGAAAVVLRRLEDALADGDPVHALILGSAVNNDGADKVGYTAPGLGGQAEVIATAQAVAGVKPAEIGYVEAHGTATPLGDSIEVAALRRAFGDAPRPFGPCYLGTVKSNVGHLDAAAGVTGLIKAALAVKHGVVPPTLHVAEPNPRIDFGDVFALPRELTPWTGAEPRQAGVSSFGIGGTNAHVILREPQTVASAHDSTSPETSTAGPVLLPLSARDPQALERLAGAYADVLESGGQTLEAAAWTAAHRRAHHEHRCAVVAGDRGQAVERLRAVGSGAVAVGVARGRAAERSGKVAFLFPGQGGQWVGMGRELLVHDRAFAAAVARCDEVLSRHVDWCVTDILVGDAADPRLERIDVIQPVLFSVSVGLVAALRARGIEPHAVVGHSMGEVTAAFVAGRLELDGAVRVIVSRSRLLAGLSGGGAMLVTDLDAESAAARIATARGRVSVAALNGPSTTVLSGDEAALDTLATSIEEAGGYAARVKVDVASHSAQVDPLRQELLASLAGLRWGEGSVAFRSTVDPGADEPALDPEYWWRNLREPVRLADTVQRLLREGFEHFVEVSPHPILVPSVEEGIRAAGRRGRAVATLRRDEPEREALLETVGWLHVGGGPTDWDLVAPPEGSFAPPPAYPWTRERYWVEAAPAAATGPSPTVPFPPGVPGTASPAVQRGTPPVASGTDEDLEAVVAGVWREALGVADVRPDDHFFRVGGHSLLAIRMLSELGRRTGRTVPVSIFLLDPTVRGLARRLQREGFDWSPLVPLRATGSRLPFFCVTPLMGTAFNYFGLAEALGRDQPFYALQPRGLNGRARPLTRIHRMAEYYADHIQELQPRGPYAVGGWSYGAPVAFELARELSERGEPVGLVALIDTPAHVDSQRPSLLQGIRFVAGRVLADIWPWVKEYWVMQSPGGEWTPAESPEAMGGGGFKLRRLFNREALGILAVTAANAISDLAYKPRPWHGRVTLLRTAATVNPETPDPLWGWGELALEGVDVRRIPGEHMTLLREPHLDEVARVLDTCLGEATAGASPPTDS